jgi:uncharacterized protein YkwD
MKNLITVVSILISFFSFSQDKELFDLVNQYRKVNGVSVVKWDDELAELSISQNKAVVEKDSLFHSHKNTYENVCKGVNIPSTMDDEVKFKEFCKKYFKYDYKFNSKIDSVELKKICKMYIVFVWHNSPSHKKNMLRTDVKIGSVNSYISDTYSVNSNTFTINGVTQSSKIVPSNYEIQFYATLNLKP